MTTIRDYLNDLIEEMKDWVLNNLGANPDQVKEKKEELLDEYIEIIKERIVG